MNSTEGSTKNEVDKIPVIGVDPRRDSQASSLFTTVKEGSFLKSRGQIVLGSNVASDLKSAIGTRIDVRMVSSGGDTVIERFVVVGISRSPGGLAFLGIALALVYWTMISVFAAFGAGGLIAPLLAAWAPNLLFGAAAGVLLLTVRT